MTPARYLCKGHKMATTSRKKWVRQMGQKHAFRRGRLTSEERLIAFIDEHKLLLEGKPRVLVFALLRQWLTGAKLSTEQWKALRNIHHQITHKL